MSKRFYVLKDIVDVNLKQVYFNPLSKLVGDEVLKILDIKKRLSKIILAVFDFSLQIVQQNKFFT